LAKLGYLPDASPEARAFAEALDDVTVSVARDRFAALHLPSLGGVRIAVREWT
jgi:hypothetical protein